MIRAEADAAALAGIPFSTARDPTRPMPKLMRHSRYIAEQPFILLNDRLYF
jgi:hypothetical protein